MTVHAAGRPACAASTVHAAPLDHGSLVASVAGVAGLHAGTAMRAGTAVDGRQGSWGQGGRVAGTIGSRVAGTIDGRVTGSAGGGGHGGTVGGSRGYVTACG